MGTIVIEQWESVGGSGVDGPIYRNLLARTADASTSTSAENITTNGSAGYISVYAVEAHRVSIGADATGNGGKYIDILAGERRDIGLQAGGQAVYYRSDA